MKQTGQSIIVRYRPVISNNAATHQDDAAALRRL